ncbi:MAG: glycosyltransferase family 9 protein [Thermodesulforhabdaceae bacterium]
MKILIVKLSALGDIVHALPVVDYIKSYLPAAEIDWVVEERFQELPAAHPLINCVYPVDTRTIRRHPVKARKVLIHLSRTMASQAYDVALDLQGNIKSAIFTILSQARLRYGFSRSEVREFPNLFATNRKVSIPGTIQPIRTKILHIVGKFLEDIEIPTPGNNMTYWNKHLDHIIDANERSHQEMLLKRQGWNGEPLIGVIPGTTRETKMWHLKRWCECLELLYKDGIGRILMFWGSPKERLFAEKILSLSRLNHGKGSNCSLLSPIIWEGGNIKSLIGALSLTSIVIGPDTGPLHLAALIGIPTVSIFRATDSAKYTPSGSTHASCQVPMPCSPCLKKKCKLNEICSLAIPAETVVNYIKTIFNATR